MTRRNSRSRLACETMAAESEPGSINRNRRRRYNPGMASMGLPTPAEPAILSREPKMSEIPAGWFRMGSDAGQDVERPVHRVWVDSFALAETQVTVAEYARFLDATRRPLPPTRSDPNFSHPEQPVTAVAWYEAMGYCDWLSGITGAHY